MGREKTGHLSKERCDGFTGSNKTTSYLCFVTQGLRVEVHFALYRYCYIVLRFVKQSFITKGVSGR